MRDMRAIQWLLAPYFTSKSKIIVRKTQIEFVQFCTVLEQIITHIYVQFGVLWLDREAAVIENACWLQNGGQGHPSNTKGSISF